MNFLENYPIASKYKDMSGLSENDARFASVMSDFVNGSMSSQKKTAKAMASDHRYLLSLKARLFIQFMFELAVAYNRGRYDARNEYACHSAAVMIEALIEKDLFYNYSYIQAMQSGDWSNIEF